MIFPLKWVQMLITVIERGIHVRLMCLCKQINFHAFLICNFSYHAYRTRYMPCPFILVTLVFGGPAIFGCSINEQSVINKANNAYVVPKDNSQA